MPVVFFCSRSQLVSVSEINTATYWQLKLFLRLTHIPLTVIEEANKQLIFTAHNQATTFRHKKKKSKGCYGAN